MRVGIFGGSFDPIHLGHLILAEQCRDQAALDRVLFIPAPRPPHKLNKAVASFDHRLAMLKLAILDQPAFLVDTCEQDRPGLSFTVDTLRYLHQREPATDWFLILGGDSVRDLSTWRDPEGIARLCKLLIVDRPDTVGIEPPNYFAYNRVQSPLIDISSTDIRERVKTGRSIRYLVPERVREYIDTSEVYGR
ncbi:MAG TPA: nicotinate-nucleotide adenylyltransferase [Gemmatales bacterium]|nr:nicotinate-nucleotide adenylyltransferase [Gemmatales bacterium]